MKPLRIALTKGRLEKDTVALLESAGYEHYWKVQVMTVQPSGKRADV